MYVSIENSRVSHIEILPDTFKFPMCYKINTLFHFNNGYYVHSLS